MTEKSEDQVVWVCHKCGYCWKENPANTPGKTHTRFKYFPDCEVEAKEVIYIEAYLSLQSNLANAVEALKESKRLLEWAVDGVIFNSTVSTYAFQDKCKEALDKIGEIK